MLPHESRNLRREKHGEDVQHLEYHRQTIASEDYSQIHSVNQEYVILMDIKYGQELVTLRKLKSLTDIL
jgi:hypothetical protein